MPKPVVLHSDIHTLHACDLGVAIQQLTQLNADRKLLDYLGAWQEWAGKDIRAPLDAKTKVTPLLSMLKAQFMEDVPDSKRPLQQARMLIAQSTELPENAQQEALNALDHCIHLSEPIATRQLMSSHHDRIQEAHGLRQKSGRGESYMLNWMYIHGDDVTRLTKQDTSWKHYLDTQLDNRQNSKQSPER